MNHIENIFVCISAPLLIAALCVGRKHCRLFLFCLFGMGACLLSSYINTFFAAAYHADAFVAAVEIAPVVEEIIKLLPLLFYLFVFDPNAEEIKTAVLTIAAGFATFENICYLIQNGAEQLPLLLFRGCGTGAMHIVCGAIIGYGLMYVWKQTWLTIVGTCGLLGAVICFHGIYNLLIAYGSPIQYVAYILPLLTILLGISWRKLYATFLIQQHH